MQWTSVFSEDYLVIFRKVNVFVSQHKQKLKDQGVNGNIELSWKKQSDGKVFHKEEEKTKKKETCASNGEL